MSTSIPKTQKQWSWDGVPNGFKGLQLRESDVPQPGPGEVLVRIHAVSLNFRDVMIANNQYFGQVIKDCVPGCDAVGEVAAIGDGVSQWNIKDRVAPTFFLGDTGAGITAENAGTSIPSESVPTGTLLQYRVYPATSLLRVPDNLSWEEAATLPCAGVTAYNALFGGPRTLRSGETVLLQGTGGVSIIAAQIARASGARVILTSSSDEKLATIAKFVDAHDTINYKKYPDWAAKALDLTNGVGAHHILDIAGGDSFDQSVQAVARGGVISVIGMINGGAPKINVPGMIWKAASLRAIPVGERWHHVELHRLLELHNIKPLVGKTFKFGQAQEAFQTLEKQNFVGKIVVLNSQE